ncbi:MAG: hypothetical protein DME19_03640 [Verrucomicrobia bacterium]|nr:MAG: hypothetical protein DME19_03640 [Verrucomicrobiota bacterium]
MNPDEAVEMENLRAIVKDQATKLELLSEQLAMTLRSNKQLLEANAQLSMNLLMSKAPQKP